MLEHRHCVSDFIIIIFSSFFSCIKKEIQFLLVCVYLHVNSLVWWSSMCVSCLLPQWGVSVAILFGHLPLVRRPDGSVRPSPCWPANWPLKCTYPEGEPKAAFIRSQTFVCLHKYTLFITRTFYVHITVSHSKNMLCVNWFKPRFRKIKRSLNILVRQLLNESWFANNLEVWGYTYIGIYKFQYLTPRW